jgi:dienelactone hydrolase
VEADMKFMFDTDAAFSYEALRAVSYTPYDGADIGEVMAVAHRITEGDWDSWHSGWQQLAARTEAIADRARRAGHHESARCAYLRASNYYRTAEFFLRDDPAHDTRLMPTWQKGVECFRNAQALSAAGWWPVTIPYEGIGLQGYYFQTDFHELRPTLLAHGGYDSTVEEMYFSVGAAAARRGWNCLIFEGPGQGAALRKHGLVFRPDWEAVVTPVVDYTLRLPGVDPDRLALLGMSLGGYLAPRAAAFERRLAACVAFDGVHDLLGALSHGISGGVGTPDPVAALDELMSRRRQQPSDLRWLLSNGIWAFGTPTATDLLAALAEYSLAGVAATITCPTLVCEAEADHFFPGQPQQLYNELTCERLLVTFTAEEGGEEHCHMGELTLFHQRVFDWLDDVVGSAEGAAGMVSQQ